MITDSELQAIAERAEAATPGPWVSHQWPRTPASRIISADQDRYSAHLDIANVLHMPKRTEAHTLANAAFIAHARTDIPRLIAEIKRLKGEANG